MGTDDSDGFYGLYKKIMDIGRIISNSELAI